MKRSLALFLTLLVFVAFSPAVFLITAQEEDSGIDSGIDSAVDGVSGDDSSISRMLFPEEYDPYFPYIPVPFPIPYYRHPHIIHYGNPYLISPNPYGYPVNGQDYQPSVNQNTEEKPRQEAQPRPPRKHHRYHPALRRAKEAARRQAKNAEAARAEAANTEPAKPTDKETRPRDTAPEQ